MIEANPSLKAKVQVVLAVVAVAVVVVVVDCFLVECRSCHQEEEVEEAVVVVEWEVVGCVEPLPLLVVWVEWEFQQSLVRIRMTGMIHLHPLHRLRHRHHRHLYEDLLLQEDNYNWQIRARCDAMTASPASI